MSPEAEQARVREKWPWRLDPQVADLAPRGPTRGQHIRIPGQSYPRIDFESLVPLVLERVSLGAADIASTVSLYHSMRGPGPDQLAIARIAHERERAAATFLRERDMAVLEAAMARLDEEERAAKVSVPAQPLPPAEVRRYLFRTLQAGPGRPLRTSVLL